MFFSEFVRRTPKACIPYKLPLTGHRDGDGRSHSGKSGPMARLELSLLLLEPGQIAAAKAQLSNAEGAMRARSEHLGTRGEIERFHFSLSEEFQY